MRLEREAVVRLFNHLFGAANVVSYPPEIWDAGPRSGHRDWRSRLAAYTKFDQVLVAHGNGRKTPYRDAFLRPIPAPGDSPLTTYDLSWAGSLRQGLARACDSRRIQATGAGQWLVLGTKLPNYTDLPARYAAVRGDSFLLLDGDGVSLAQAVLGRRRDRAAERALMDFAQERMP